MDDHAAGISYDLHLHTEWSYDAMAPVDLYFRRARDRGMHCIAITEHHHLDSLPEILRTGSRYPAVRFIPAAELTVHTSIGSVDLLCYGFPFEFGPALRDVIDHYHEWQREYGAALSRGLRAVGCDYTDDDRLALLKSYRAAHIIDEQGNTHVRNPLQAEYFVKRGFISDVEQYHDLLRRAAQAVPRPPYPAVDLVVPVVHDTGALIAVAHPRAYFNGIDEKHMDALRDECALDGIECAHPSTPPEFGAAYRRYCVRHGMVSVAGSDCHVPEHLDTLFARHGGTEEWLDELLGRLRR